MPHRRSLGRGRGISQSQRRKKTWIAVKNVVDVSRTPGFLTSFAIEVVTPVGLTGSSTVEVLAAMTGDGTAGSPFISTLPEESTILRIRGSVLFPKNVIDASGTLIEAEFAIGFGVKAISDNLIPSFPAPVTDVDWDGWMFRRESAVSPVDSEGTVIDVKSMRKIKSGDAFFVAVEGVSGTAASTTGVFVMDLRLLLLLP